MYEQPTHSVTTIIQSKDLRSHSDATCVKSLKTEEFKIVSELEVYVSSAFSAILSHLQHRNSNNICLKP